MKTWKARLAFAAVVFIFICGALLWNSNLVVLIVYRHHFDGGIIALENGSSANVEGGSGPTVVFLILKAATDVSLSCEAGDRIHIERKGYIEPGPIQYMTIEIKGCEFTIPGTPKNILDLI